MAINTSTISDPNAQRQLFVLVQAAKASVGVALGLAFFGVAGRPDLAETIALAGLAAPGVLAILGLTSIPLARLEQIGLAGFAALIGYLALLTGGVASPLVVWFALVPAEGALSGGRPAVVRAGLAAGAALLVVAVMQAMGALPASRLLYSGALPLWEIYACSVLAALVQAVLIAAAAQDRQRAADAAAAEGAAMYRFLADNAMDLITRHSPDGRIRFASPATSPLLGRLPDEIVGLALPTILHPDDLDAVQAALMESSYHGRAGSAEVRLRHKDGHFVWAEIRCRPARESAGEPADIVAVTRDISQRKAQEWALVEARDAALAANRAKSRFLANMSHELRTPLNAIIGFSEVMTREMFGPVGPRYQEYSRLIHESGAHLLELINSVLDMSKIEAGKFELAEELFDLGDVADSAVRFLKIPAERAGVALKLDIAPSARLVFADRRAVKQILVNLLSNGVKYTPPGGVVTVTARPEKGIEITVRDTGTGISKADLEQLGQPFEQVQNAEVRTKEGTGLGLALVKALAVMHGGEAVLASALGEGTIVTVRLPHAAVNAKGERLSTGKVLPFRAA
ncbi:MAG: PAS domain-containing sensor histidine kinase [Alphaproteobacteria bacterium]|nr:PAS domain-containing sensor histidine kinase [Alphaproteobacteria bacterium]